MFLFLYFYFRQGTAALHTRDRVQNPGTYILKIRATVENVTPRLSTFQTEPFYLTVHLIITKWDFYKCIKYL